MQVSVGIVGFGEVAQYHLRHLREAGAEVTAAVTSRRTPTGIRRHPDLASMLGSVDAVTVAVPNHLHARLCRQAVAAGTPVLVEKPLCLTEEDCDALAAVAAGSGVPVLVGYRLRWNPALRHLHGSLQGTVRRVRCTYTMGLERLARDKPWTREAASSGGPFFTLGPHALDLARWFAGARGEPLRDVEARTGVVTPEADFPLVASMAGVLPGGVRVEAGVDLRGDATFRLDLEVDSAGEPVTLAAALDDLPGPGPEDPGAADAEYGGLMRAFVAAVESGQVTDPGFEECLQTHRDLVAADRLARAGSGGT